MVGPRRATPAGRTLTEFEANEEVSRPNYRGSDNEKESLTRGLPKALERTVKGLRAVPAHRGAMRPRDRRRRRAGDGRDSRGDRPGGRVTDEPAGLRRIRSPAAGRGPRLERESQPGLPEVL